MPSCLLFEVKSVHLKLSVLQSGVGSLSVFSETIGTFCFKAFFQELPSDWVFNFPQLTFLQIVILQSFWMISAGFVQNYYLGLLLPTLSTHNMATYMGLIKTLKNKSQQTLTQKGDVRLTKLWNGGKMETKVFPWDWFTLRAA